ncbi:MAG: aminotransferase class V-fold PLP-dependent enzyme [Gemmatimonadota bacterium]
MSFDLDAVRSEFPILGRRTYLNSCSLGALSRRAEGRLDEFRELWHAMGASAWYEHWLGRIEELRGRAAAFVGAEAAHVALLPSTSVALAVVAESVGPGSDPPGGEGRNRIVTTELDFPTLVYQWTVRPDLEVVVLPSDDGVGVPVERFADAVDERTLFLATSHVYFSTGYVQDLAGLASVAHDAGALCLIDAYQGPGQVAVDVPTPGVDFFTWGPLKWLCGGPGLAYLWVRPELIGRLEPRITSWFATEDQFAFDPRAFRYRPDARRFEMGTPALPTVHTALGGQEILDEVGAVAVEERNRALTTRLVEGCREAGMELRIAADLDRRSAIVMVAHDDPSGAVAHLSRNGVIVDHRPGHVRISPHFYNTGDEVDRVVRLLAGFGS